jgi:hypothetical protein
MIDAIIGVRIMKKLYTFKWKYGKIEEPLQASSEMQALRILAINIARKNPHVTEENCMKMVFNAFRNSRLDYDLADPYVPPKKEPANPEPKPEPKKPDGTKYVQSFLDFTKKE